MAVLLKNATYIDYQTLAFKKCDILVTDGSQGTATPLDDSAQFQIAEGTEVIDCNGKFVTHAFACGHHHIYSALSRGMGAPAKNPSNFFEILQYIWWTLDKSLDKDMIEASALATGIACAKNGVSFVIDHHASPFAVEGSLETIAKALDKIGLSHLLCYEISDRDGLDIAQKGLDETASYLKNRQGLVGLHASFTVGSDTLKKSVELAEKTGSGIHIHVAEDRHDQNECLVNHGMRVVERLHRHGVLSMPKSILGHCLHLDTGEKALIRDSKAWVVQNMESNLNNQVGFFNGDGLGPRIMLGTDGMHSDMIRSARAAFYAGHNYEPIDYAGTYQRFRNVHKYIQENGFSGDASNNLVVLNYDTPTEFNQNNFLGHFLFGFDSRQVQHLISSGKVVVKDYRLTNIDEEAVLQFTREMSVKLWAKMKSL